MSMSMEKLPIVLFDDGWAAVANGRLDDFGDVGYLDFEFLKKILPHCTKDQLVHIEKSTKDVDLSPITNTLWRSFFLKEFGVKATNEVIREMKMKKVTSFKWSELFQEKLKREEAEKAACERLKIKYANEAARKQNRQIRVLEKAPAGSSSNFKRSSCVKKPGKLMAKVKKEYEKSLEAKNVQAMKMKRALKNPSLAKMPRDLLARTIAINAF